MDYYTGMVFEVYASGLGRPLGGGGRYDRLLEGFGRPLQATGFALNLPQIVKLLELQGVTVHEPRRHYYIKPAPGQFSRGSEIARQIRARGEIAEVDLSDRSEDECAVYAKNKGFVKLLVVNESNIITIDLNQTGSGSAN
jgi:ATP phosphoribosyltransferase regulatory subunit